tara:strand:+ start:274 stop:924 length:651 start_codon:yes stop_codon:yes gene_type:complete
MNADASKTDYVHHPKPTKPIFLNTNLYKKFKTQMTPPPSMESKEQKNDEKILFNHQISRSKEVCEISKTEVFVNLSNFYGKPNGPLSKKQVSRLNPFFDKIRNDGDFFIQKIKKNYSRKRPFEYLKNIHPCVPKEVTKAYPSGHATLAHLYALILSDFFPNKKNELLKRGEEIGNHRVIVGVHHPTDITSGRALAFMIYKELKKSKKYQKEINKLK